MSIGFLHHTLSCAATIVLFVSLTALAQQDGSSPSAPPVKGLPPAPKSINLPPAPEPVKPAPGSEPAGLPPPPKLSKKFPGNQVIEVGKNDPRIAVDLNEMPWRAIGRLQAGGGSCTASLIGPSLLLTAAHCVFDARTRQQFAAKTLDFKLAYSDGKYSAHANGVRITVADDYDPILNIGTMSKDWAVVELDQAIGTRDNILTMRDKTPAAGDTAALGGYANDMIEHLMADPECRVLGLMFDSDGLPLIRHNCAATQGVSGAPLLIQDGAGWSIGGIEVVGAENRIGGASLLYEVRKAIAKLSDALPPQ